MPKIVGGNLVERDKYVAMWEFDEYRSHSPGERYVTEVHFRPKSSVIDFGCGCGRATTGLAELGYRVLGVDFAHNCLDADCNVPFLVADLTKLPPLRADYGFCCDVMEHIPTESVDAVLSGIARSVKEAFFAIALHPDSAGWLIGQKLHMTVETSQWWQDKLQKHFANVHCEDRGYSAIAIVS